MKNLFYLSDEIFGNIGLVIVLLTDMYDDRAILLLGLVHELITGFCPLQRGLVVLDFLSVGNFMRKKLKFTA